MVCDVRCLPLSKSEQITVSVLVVDGYTSDTKSYPIVMYKVENPIYDNKDID